MRLLHTSDWHLGKSLYNHSRRADHEAVLQEIVEHARATKPDLVLHTGDVFDSFRPGYDDMHLAVDTVRQLAELAPVVLLRGNHDSLPLFRLLQKLAGNVRCAFVDQPRRPRDGGVMTFESRLGHRIRLACLPFVHQNRMIDAFEDPAHWTGEYQKRIRAIMEVLHDGLMDSAGEGDIRVFAAHLHVSGAVLSGSERKVHVADDYAGAIEHLPAVSYAAFGHIHKPQPLPSTLVTGAYAGSPLQLDFGELGEDKSVVLVEAEPGRPARVERLPLRRGRRLREWAGTLAELAAAAEDLGDALCRLFIDTETPDAELSRNIAEAAPALTPVQVVERCAARTLEALDRADDEPVEDAGLGELFRDYLAERGTRDAPAERVLEVFSAVLSAIEVEDAPRLPGEDAFAFDLDAAGAGEERP